ncbi:allatostatin-A receptor-like [Saccostrea cucullata]|uniref:allatostatin-A receptor-like n=1 Tax=Saccostrea cuccullata TaxID=36930 RepID=UPI002ED051A9
MEFERLVQSLIPVIFGLIVLVGIVGNALVIVVILAKKKLQNTTNILVVSLATADLLFVVFCASFTAANYAISYWPFGNVWCKLVNFISHVCAYASVWTLVLLSIDRYIAVVHPVLSKRIRNRQNTCILVLVTWTLICCGNFPILFQYGIVHYTWMGQNRSACVNLAGVGNKLVFKVFYGCFFALGYALPLSLINLCYGCLLKTLCRRSHLRQKSQRTTKFVITFVVAFAICWLPIQVILIVQTFTDYEITIGSTAVLMTANCLAYANSCINPLLYAILSENFRRYLRNSTCFSKPVYFADRRGTRETLVLSKA